MKTIKITVITKVTDEFFKEKMSKSRDSILSGDFVKESKEQSKGGIKEMEVSYEELTTSIN